MAIDKSENREVSTGKRGLIILVLLAIIVSGLVGALAGLIVPQVFSANAVFQGASAANEEVTEEANLTTHALDAIVVDLHDIEGIQHHLKTVMSIELAELVGEEAYARYLPRGRAAAVAYLRALPYETTVDGKQFGDVTQQLGERVRDAAGSGRVVRVVVTDYVVQ